MNNNLPANYQTGLAAIIPQNMQELMKFAELLARSTMVPKDYINKPGNVLIAMQWGSELGIPPLQAIQNIAVINSRPAIWGDLALALVSGSGLLEDIQEEQTDEGATCTVIRKGRKPATRTFNVADAKSAGLWKKAGPWTQYPKRMMQMRARAFALRDVFPDVLKGIRVAEEERDVLIAQDRVAELPLSPDEPLALNAAPSEDPVLRTLVNIIDMHIDKLVRHAGFDPDAYFAGEYMNYRQDKAEAEALSEIVQKLWIEHINKKNAVESANNALNSHLKDDKQPVKATRYQREVIDGLRKEQRMNKPTFEGWLAGYGYTWETLTDKQAADCIKMLNELAQEALDADEVTDADIVPADSPLGRQQAQEVAA